jgi:ATP-dependent Clp protease protease subunit
LESTLAQHTGQTVERIRADIDRDKILTSIEAKEYGIIDEITQIRKLSAAR